MFFMKPTASKLRQQDLEEAERELGAHRKSAEYHMAMSAMYAERVSRLKDEIELAAMPAEPRGIVVPYGPVETPSNG